MYPARALNLPSDDAKDISESLHPTSSLVSVSKNLVDSVWSDRPARPEEPVTVHPLKYAGQSVEDKISDIRQALEKSKHRPYGTVVNMLDEVAWLFNLRGTDIPYNPVFFAYAIVTMDEVLLFVDSAKLSDDVYKNLGSGVTVRPYEDVLSGCKEVANKLSKGQKVGEASHLLASSSLMHAQILVGKSASLALAEAIGKENVVIADSLINEAKAIKNEVEQEGFRQCHIVRILCPCETQTKC